MATLNQKRLWIVATILWCGTIILAFGLRVRVDYQRTQSSYESAVHDELHAEWLQCIERIGSTPQIEHQKQSELCSQQDFDTLCKGAMFRDECVNSLDLICMQGIESREPGCRTIYDRFEKRSISDSLSAFPTNRILFFLRGSHSQHFWAELILLLLGPVIFLLVPKLKRWLYSG